MSEFPESWLRENVCPTCGKAFFELYPNLWRFKRQRRGKGAFLHFCSWKCLREDEKKEEEERKNKMRIMNDQVEMGRKLADAMERGEDPYEFLRKQGYTNPPKAYANIRNKCIEKDPELAARFPDRRKEKKPGKEPEKKAPEERFAEIREELMKAPAVKIDGEMVIRSREPEKIRVEGTEPAAHAAGGPLGQIRPKVLEGAVGEWEIQQDGVVFKGYDGEHLKLSVEKWLALCAETPEALRIFRDGIR